MTRTADNERLKAALDFGKLSPHERRLKVYQARKSPPIEPTHDQLTEFVYGPTVTVRMNRRLKELVEAAFPDENVRKADISKLIVMECLKRIKERHNSKIVQ